MLQEYLYTIDVLTCLQSKLESEYNWLYVLYGFILGNMTFTVPAAYFLIKTVYGIKILTVVKITSLRQSLAICTKRIFELHPELTFSIQDTLDFNQLLGFVYDHIAEVQDVIYENSKYWDDEKERVIIRLMLNKDYMCKVHQYTGKTFKQIFDIDWLFMRYEDYFKNELLNYHIQFRDSISMIF